MSLQTFARLIENLDGTNKTSLKVNALADYFRNASDVDKIWTIALLSHRRPPRPVNTTLLRLYATELSNIPLWLFEESYHIVGDLAETIALVINTDEQQTSKRLSDCLEEIIVLKTKDDDEKKAYLQSNWLSLDYYSRFVFTKLLTGSFRIGVSQKLMTKALAQITGVDEDHLAYRLMGDWNPSKTTFQELIYETNLEANYSKLYPFYLAYAIEGEIEGLGDVHDWAIEHKWDGIRGQVIHRNGEIYVWSRGEELVTDKYPEFGELKNTLADGIVLDGEILPFINGEIGLFNDLQTRIGRKNISKSILEKVPVIFKAYDVLEYDGQDCRNLSYLERRSLLDKIVASNKSPSLHFSEMLTFDSWEEVSKERQLSRQKRSEGLMLKRKNATYQVGRKKGDWWKWKTDPFTIDAVLTYAMRGHGRRSNLFTDYTFGLWQTNDKGKRELVTFAKAYSGLTDKEFNKVDAIIKKTTLERFGPVRSVEPQLVFEIAFEGIALSSRHKSGVAVRFPRIHRWRHDKKIEEANSLDDLKGMILS